MDPIVDEAVERGPVFLVADAQGRYLYVNKAWEDMKWNPRPSRPLWSSAG